MEPAPQGCNSPPDAPAPTRQSNPYGKWISALADLAPTLKEAELRVALELARRADATGELSIRASSRDLANHCKLSRAKLQAALDSLAERLLIATRQGTTTTASAHRLNFLETVSIGGSLREPPPPAKGWHPKEATQAPLWSQGGSEGEPPPTGNKELPPAGGAVDTTEPSIPIFDRVLKSKPADHDPELLAYTRRWLHGYMTKRGVDERNRPFSHESPPHPPDDRLVAQVLAIADPPQIFAVLENLLSDGKTAYSYGWFVTVLLQRVHGIHWQQTQKARQKLALATKYQKATDPRWQQQTIDAVHELAKAKGMK